MCIVDLGLIMSALNFVEERSFVGDMSGGGTPGPISNPAVKPASADGSMWFLHARVGHCQRIFAFPLLVIIVCRSYR